MPNLQPVPDCTENLAVALACIKKSAVIRVYPYAAITLGQNGQTLCDFSALSRQAIAFSDDGRGVQDEALMRIAMQKVHALGKMIVAHCEDDSFLDGLCLHDGAFTASLGLKGIAAKSEWGQLARDIRLLRQTHCAYHACHISTKESVSLIRRAKREGLDITCETAPHYLLLDDSQLLDDGRFKMNPPIRAKEDREALIEGILDGTIDMIATDHAPHAPEEKSRGIAHSLNGVVGIETAFSVLYTELVKTGILSLSQLITLMHTAPQKRFQIETPLRIHAPANLTVFDLRKKERIDPQSFLSMGKSCPFSGRKVFGKCMLTICNGAIAWKSPDLITSEDNR